MAAIERPAVLFVCLGNICRSPLAEAALRTAVEKARLDIHVDSAGTGSWHIGAPPDRRAIAAAARRAIDISNLRARQLSSEDFHRFTHIFALDHDNLADIRLRTPEGSIARVGLLLDVVPGRAGEAVADPYFGEESGFEATWADVEAAAQALVELFRY